MERNLDPQGNYYFALEISGKEVAHFMEVSGLKSTTAVFEIEEGGMNGRTHKRPGQSKWENIVCRFATSTSTALLEWRDEYLMDKFKQRVTDPMRSSGAIILYDNKGEEVRRYSFTGAWPVSWEGPSLSASSSELAVESIEIAHDGLRISSKR